MAVHIVTSRDRIDGGGKSTPKPKSTYTQVTSRTTAKPMVYDPTTGGWKESTTKPKPPTTHSVPKTSTSTSRDSDKGSSTPITSSNTVDSKTQAEKEYIATEFNTLTGELKLTSTEKSIRLKVNDTVKLEGLGNYLSGLYFVHSIKRTLTKDGGYSHTLSLIKNGFGSSVKKAPPVTKEEPRKEKVKKEPAPLKVGDKVKIVGDDAVYSNAHNGVKVPGWVKKKTHTIYDTSNDKTRVLLKEIWSWTYVKFIQKL